MRHNPHYSPRPRVPLGLLLLVALVGLLVLAGMLGWLAWQFALLDPSVAGALRVALFVLLYGIPAGGAAVGLISAYNRYGWREAIRAEKNAQFIRAHVQRFPDSLTSLSYHDSSRPTLAPPVDAPEPEAPELPGPLDLATLDVRPSESRILLGLDTAGPITVSVQQLCHVALLGATGGGKSNLLRLILPQLLAFGASVCLADPHYAPIDPESGDDWRRIAQRLRFPPAVKSAEIDQLLTFMTEELARRLEKRNRGERVGVPLFLAFDELPTIADMVPDAVPRIGKLLREGRKVHLLTVGASQSLLIKEVGGSSALRDQYRTACYVGGDKKSASAVLDLPERTIDDGPLGKGVILLRSEATRPARLVRVPLVSNAAIDALLGGPDLGSAPVPAGLPPGSPAPIQAPAGTQAEPTRNPAEPAPGAETITSAEHARMLALFAEGHDIAEIVRRIWPDATKGRQTQERSRQVQEALRQAMKGA